MSKDFYPEKLKSFSALVLYLRLFALSVLSVLSVFSVFSVLLNLTPCLFTG